MKKFFISLAGSSVLWGLVATFLFYFAINAGLLRNETIVRYCAGHPVEYATVAMFWIGFCDLTLKLWTTRRERRALKRGALFPPKHVEKERVSKVDDYLQTIAKARDVRGESTYLTRLADALDFMKFGGSPDELDQELRVLADDAYDRRDAEYGMARAFIWAIPILGFLGTVLGITVALGSLDLTRIEATGESLAAGLKVAFDTTALALSLVFVLYFLLFFSRKQDARLASAVGKLVDSELKGRFYADDDLAANGDLESTRRLMNSVVDAFAQTTRTQAALWNETSANVALKFVESTQEAATRFADAIDKRLTDGEANWTKSLQQTQREFVDATLRPVLEQSAQTAARLSALEEKVVHETEMLHDVLRASADVVALEDRFARSLEKIAEVGEFEKTLNNLSATVCLLNSKLTATSAANYSEPLRFDSILAQRSNKRASKRSEALAALDSLEDSLDASLNVSNDAQENDASPVVEANDSNDGGAQTIVLREFDDVPNADAPNPDSDKVDGAQESAQDACDSEPKAKRSRALLARTRRSA